jgi:hypothetical protein
MFHRPEANQNEHNVAVGLFEKHQRMWCVEAKEEVKLTNEQQQHDDDEETDRHHPNQKEEELGDSSFDFDTTTRSTGCYFLFRFVLLFFRFLLTDCTAAPTTTATTSTIGWFDF